MGGNYFIHMPHTFEHAACTPFECRIRKLRRRDEMPWGGLRGWKNGKIEVLKKCRRLFNFTYLVEIHFCGTVLIRGGKYGRRKQEDGSGV